MRSPALLQEPREAARRRRGLGFRVWGLGFRVWGLGFRFWGLGFMWGLGFRVQAAKARAELWNFRG